VFGNKLVKVYYASANINVRGPYLEVMTMTDRRESDASGAHSSLDIHFPCSLGASRFAYMEDDSPHLGNSTSCSVHNPVITLTKNLMPMPIHESWRSRTIIPWLIAAEAHKV
jgi:hypothetical protein